MMAGKYKTEIEAHKNEWNVDMIEKYNHKVTMSYVLLVVFCLLACCFMTCICCGFRSLKLAIDVIDASADFLATTKRIIFVPVLYFFLGMLVFMGWIFAFMNVASLNDIKPDTRVIPQMKDVVWNKSYVKFMALFMIFGLYWIMAWLKYTCNFICMVSASTYYFNSSKDKEGSAEVGFAFKLAHINHTGSIAFGAFIIALFQFIRLIFLYLAEKASEAGGENPAIKCIVACG